MTFGWYLDSSVGDDSLSESSRTNRDMLRGWGETIQMIHSFHGDLPRGFHTLLLMLNNDVTDSRRGHCSVVKRSPGRMAQLDYPTLCHGVCSRDPFSCAFS